MVSKSPEKKKQLIRLRPTQNTLISEFSCPFGGKKFEDEQWIYRHPGGYNNLRCAYEVEEDASNLLFLSYHMGHDINRALRTGASLGYKLPQPTALHRELNQIFHDVKKEYWIHGYVNRVFCAFVLFMIIFMFLWQLLYQWWAPRLVFGFIGLVHGFVIFHTKHHCGKLFDNKILNFLSNHISSFYSNTTIFFPTRRWIDVHQKSHHIYTNTDEDNDIWLAYPFIYEHNNSADGRYKVRNINKYQTFYTPFLFMMMGFFGSIRQLTLRDPITQKKIGNGIFVLLHFTIYLVLPFWIHGRYLETFVLYIMCHMGYGCLYAYLFQVSHNVQGLRFPRYVPKENTLSELEAEAEAGAGAEEEDAGVDQMSMEYDIWLKQQIETSMSYCCDNSDSWVTYIWNYMFTLTFGGINCQIEHHIAPAVHPIFYFFASPRIQAFCEKHGIYYATEKSFYHAWRAYHKHLFDIAKNALKKRIGSGNEKQKKSQ
jgi:fatty acid desaturase